MTATHRVAFLTGPEQIEIREVPLDDPSSGEVIVRIEAATTCGTDVKVFLRGGHPRMLVAPAPFGHEMSGTIARAGAGVSGWREGDGVIVANSVSCGVCDECGRGRENLCDELEYLNGAYGEFIKVPPQFVRRSLYRRPPQLDPAVAAIAEPLACVLHGYALLDLSQGSDVVVYGAGPIGLLFVNVLTISGHRAVAADPNRSRLDVARRLGANQTLEVNRGPGDATRARSLATSKKGFDAAIEATGSPLAWASAADSVRPGGITLLFGGCTPGTTASLDTYRTHYSEMTLRGAYHHTPRSFLRAVDLLGAQHLRTEQILTGERKLDQVRDALQSMIRKEALKVTIRP